MSSTGGQHLGDLPVPDCTVALSFGSVLTSDGRHPPTAAYFLMNPSVIAIRWGTRSMTPRGTKVKASFRIGVVWKSQVQPRDALQHRLGAVELAGRSFRAAAARDPTLVQVLQSSGTATGRTSTDIRSISIYTQKSKSLGRLIYGVISPNCAWRLRLVFMYWFPESGYRAPVESMMSAGGARRWREIQLPRPPWSRWCEPLPCSRNFTRNHPRPQGHSPSSGLEAGFRLAQLSAVNSTDLPVT